jgi:Fe-Mn family superoxide dismutase
MSQCYPFVNTPLPYGFGAMEPYIDEKTMWLHHEKHLQSYIDHLNDLLKDCPCFQRWTLVRLLQNSRSLPSSIRIPVLRNAGGVFNHRFFFEGLQSPSEIFPNTALYRQICRQFGSFEAFVEAFREEALSVFGSGYAWLVAEKGRLSICSTANQTVPDLSVQNPILNLDVWEHAYYLKHYNVRNDYITDWFSVVNWEKAEQRYLGIAPLSF